MWQSHLLWAGCIPALILFAAVSFERWRRKRKGERSPLPDKLLRPPGYSMQRKLEDLNDDFMTWFMAAFLFSILIVIFPPTRPADVWAPFVALVFFGLIAVACTFVALRKLTQIHKYRRGLLGEQAVAEQLQSLLGSGYRVFHDIPKKDGKGNIDHAVVGPAGVFAIETKYRTKQPGKAGERDCDAIFDGNKIQFPSGYDLRAPEQARQNARWLANTLSEATGARVTVQPIVALPGWWVTLKANSDVKVLSGKQIASFIAKEPSQLSAQVIQQIIYQLEQRCRDLEF
jgi:hypothetical protein